MKKIVVNNDYISALAVQADIVYGMTFSCPSEMSDEMFESGKEESKKLWEEIDKVDFLPGQKELLGTAFVDLKNEFFEKGYYNKRAADALLEDFNGLCKKLDVEPLDSEYFDSCDGQCYYNKNAKKRADATLKNELDGLCDTTNKRGLK